MRRVIASRTVIASVLTLVLVSFGTSARADDSLKSPVALVDQPILLPPGGFNLWVPSDINLTPNYAGRPTSFNPSLYVGILPDVAFGVRTITGLCIGGAARGCPQVFNDASAEFVIGLGRSPGWDGALRLAVNASPIGQGNFKQVVSTQGNTTWSGEAGIEAKLRGRYVSLVFTPSVTIGLVDRDTRARVNATSFAGFGTYEIIFPGPITSNREFLSTPVTLQVQALPILALFAGAAYQTEVNPIGAAFGDTYEIPAVVGAAFGVHNVEIGASLLYPNLFGKNSNSTDRMGNVFLGIRTP